MSAEALVEVEPRTEDQDVVLWVECFVAAAISADHTARSPGCISKTMTYVKIPVPENVPFVGGTPRLHS